MIDLELFITLFTIIGVFYYLKKYSQLKNETELFTIIFLCVILIYFIDWIWKLLIFDVDFDFKNIIFHVFAVLKNILLGSIGVYFLRELNLLKAPVLNFPDQPKIFNLKRVINDSVYLFQNIS